MSSLIYLTATVMGVNSGRSDSGVKTADIPSPLRAMLPSMGETPPVTLMLLEFTVAGSTDSLNDIVITESRATREAPVPGVMLMTPGGPSSRMTIPISDARTVSFILPEAFPMPPE